VIHERRGATLLEVMVALGILATAYVALMQVQSGSIRLSTYGKQLTVATFLAQSKLEEVQEELIKEGFPDMDETDEDNFDELGYQNFRWKLEILKIELPLGAAFEQLLTSFGQPTAGGDDKASSSSALGSMAGNPDLGQFSGLLQGAGGKMGGMASLISPEMLRGQVDMLSDMLEQAIREVRLTVTWGDGRPGDEMVITTHIVQVPQASAAQGAQPGTAAGQPGTTGLPGGAKLPSGINLPSNVNTGINKYIPQQYMRGGAKSTGARK